MFQTSVNALKFGIGLLLLAGVAINFVNVLLRYIFGRPFPWTEEVMIFGLIFIVMVGTVVATALDSHLRIDVIQNILPRLGQRILRMFSHGVWIGLSIFLAFQSYAVVTLMMRLGQTSMVTRLPTWIPHSVVFASFVLSACAAAYLMVRELTSPPEERQVSLPDTATVKEAEPGRRDDV